MSSNNQSQASSNQEPDANENASLCSTNSSTLNSHSKTNDDEDDSASQSHLTLDRFGFFGGSQYTIQPSADARAHQPSPETILRRERKWLKMLDLYTPYVTRRYRKLRERCRKGIPMSVRPKAWFYLCGGKLLLERYPHRYEACLAMEIDERSRDEIGKDLHRQFPFHEMFRNEDRPGQKELANILHAYVAYNPQIGYCQAQGPIAAFLLLHLPAEHAFWSLVSICDKYLANYYHPGMETIQKDAHLLQSLLKRCSPPTYKHLRRVGAEPMFYCCEWFLCAFTRALPWTTLLRVWDIFLCEGIKVLFKVALVILIGCFSNSSNRKKCPDLCSTLALLRNPSPEILEEEFMVESMMKLGLTERDFAEEHTKVAIKLRKEKLEQQKQQEK